MISNTSNDKSKKQFNFRELIKSTGFLKSLAGILIGGTAGYLYYHFVGCSSGSCAITSNPYMSIIFGSAMGYFLLNSSCAGSKC